MRVQSAPACTLAVIDCFCAGFFSYFRCAEKYSRDPIYFLKASSYFPALSSATASLTSSIAFDLKSTYAILTVRPQITSSALHNLTPHSREQTRFCKEPRQESISGKSTDDVDSTTLLRRARGASREVVLYNRQKRRARSAGEPENDATHPHSTHLHRYIVQCTATTRHDVSGNGEVKSGRWRRPR